MTTVLPASRLIGRSAELEVLFGLVDRIPQGGGALLLSGEPGIGKTSLLEAASRHAAERGVQVLSGVGVPSEADLPFSGLHQLLLLGSDRSSAPPAASAGDPQVSTSMFDRLEQLAEPQRDALRSAFGLDVEPAPDRFLVGLAVLSLLSEAAEERPLLCVVDDAQWLDQTSAQALAFVARRLSAEPVAIVFAAGEQGENFRGLPELTVEGLPDAEALELLHSAVQAPLDERVSERILGESRGNPLALLELPRGLSPAQLAGGSGFRP